MVRSNVLSDSQALDKFVEGCRALKHEPLGDGFGTYDFYPWWHHRAMFTLTPPGTSTRRSMAHSGPVFGPWHRLMLLVFEFDMRRVLGDDDFRLPYWDWGAEDDPTNSPLWHALVMGGSGDPVGNGPFAGAEWPVRLTQDGNADRMIRVDLGLRRNVGARADTLAENGDISQVVGNTSTYATFPWSDSPNNSGFRIQLEIPMHNMVHQLVGGDMMASTSPNDPVFFLHHANIDRIWAAWQAEHGHDVYTPGPTAPDYLDGHRLNDRLHSFLSQRVTPRMMLDYRTYYEYDSLANVRP